MKSNAKSTLLSILMALSSVVPMVARAADATSDAGSPGLVIGTGQFSCGQFAEYHKQDDKVQMDLIVQWFWGFLTAYNYRGSFGTTLRPASLIPPPDSPTVVLFVGKYCERHPLQLIVNAGLAMIHELGGTVYWHPERAEPPTRNKSN